MGGNGLDTGSGHYSGDEGIENFNSKSRYENTTAKLYTFVLI